MISQLAGIFSPGRRSRCSDASASEGGTPRESRGPGGLQHLQAALNAAFEAEDMGLLTDTARSACQVPDGSEPPETEAKASGEAGHALETEQEACSEQAPLADEEKALPCDDDQSDEDMPEAPETEQAACSEQAPADEEAQGEGPAKALETEQEACGEPPDAEALPCDDDMSDEEAPEAEQAASEAPPEAESTGDQVPAEDAEVLPCDDDMSDEVEGERSPETREVPNAAETRPVRGEGALATPRRQSVASKVAQCKARLAELQAMKAQKLEEEDYMGAHEAKQMIQDQEAELQALRLEGTPTPARAAGEAPTTWRPAAPGFMELPGEEPFLLPVETFDKLYGYQRQGVAWMANLFRKKHGGVLADEMGLGKTIQVCALLNGARKAGATHALLVMPVTLLDQWGREARLWCPGWPVYVYYGTAAQRAKALRGLRRPMGGLLLTSYSLVSNCEELLQVQVEDVPEPTRRRGRPPGEKPSKRRKLDDDDGEDKEAESEEEQEPEAPGGELPVVGSTRPWDLVICDEAHRMKNMSSLLAKSLRKLKSNSRLLLTGTPVQNALQDLWALMDFAQPGLLGNHATFVKTFSEPIDRGSVRGAKVWAVELKKHLAEQLRALISPHLLRRTKTSTGMGGEGPDVVEDVEMEDNAEDVEGAVKKLPPKKETLVWLHPSEQQVAMYKKVLENSEVIREACHKSKLGIEVFRAIGLLKRLCNHPLLLLRLPKVKDWAELLKEVQEAEAELSDPEDKESTPAPSETSADVAEEECRDVEAMLKTLSHSKEDVLQQSAKLQCLSRLLPELAQRGHRTLVFSQSVKMLDLIQICCLRPNGLRCLRIDGLTEAQARAEKVAKFNSQPERFQCMLLTTAVGGVGLNLTAADRVVVVDPAWNPATDAQAVDRAYRIGQTKEVHVYRLIMSGLVEDKMFRLQVFKMGLTRTALEADQQHRYFTAKEIRALFEWVDPAKGETRQLLREAHGEDAEVGCTASALEDGASAEGWLQPPALGMSDFACLYSQSAQEEEAPDENFSAQVAEARQKLGAADEKLQEKQRAKEEVEAQMAQLGRDLEEVTNSLDALKERRQRSEEVLKDKRSELTQARREEGAAQQRGEKASRHFTTLQDKLLQQQHAVTVANEASESSAKNAVEAVQTARSGCENFSKAVADASKQLEIVDERGGAAGDGAADAAPDRLRKALKALDKLKNAMDNNNFREGELETTEENLLKIEPGRERDRHRLEQLVSKAHQRAETSREAVLTAVQNLVEAGMWFAECLQKTQKRPVKMEQVKAVQSAVKAAFKQLPKAWQAAKAAKEAQGKAAAQRRKAASRAAACQAARQDAEAQVEAASKEQQAAEADEERCRGVRSTRESELAEAEATRRAVEAEEVEAKKRREDLKASQPTLKEALKAAKAAEREADGERKALHARAEKREKERERLEEAKNTAVKHLKNEEYDANQVQVAYEEKRGAKRAAE